MLRLIAYDISNPKRLRLVAEACADHGIRVQKSLFECWLDQERFEVLWRRLEEIVVQDQDSLAAYVLDRGACKHRRAIGKGMTFTQPKTIFVL